ncbi:MarR family transcriptional regulator [Paenibacillus sediminis]|uniref:DNA-binding MarR family transcriptional regulator n=1 Tax=Paenibacillus sediminis TaxID=664909 RepID=A0ABS4H2M3_9BACL|nr:DNA-binding MarR family transcriptional regulator [Paenibacillus sediminis]
MTKNLIKAFMRFNKADFHQRTLPGYTPSEIRLIFRLKHMVNPDSPGIKVSEISNTLRVTSPTVTQWINGLEAKGMVERIIDEQDRRAVRVKLTEAGTKLATEAQAAMFRRFQGLVNYLGDEDSVKLAELLTKVFTYLNENEVSMNHGPESGDDQ